MPGLQLLPFLSYQGKTNRVVELPPSTPKLGLNIMKLSRSYQLFYYSRKSVINIGRTKEPLITKDTMLLYLTQRNTPIMSYAN